MTYKQSYFNPLKDCPILQKLMESATDADRSVLAAEWFKLSPEGVRALENTLERFTKK